MTFFNLQAPMVAIPKRKPGFLDGLVSGYQNGRENEEFVEAITPTVDRLTGGQNMPPRNAAGALPAKSTAGGITGWLQNLGNTVGANPRQPTPDQMPSDPNSPPPVAGSPNARAVGAFGQIPSNYFGSTRQAESGGSLTAKNPRSSALGPYQFTEGTWGDVSQRYPELGLTPDGRTDADQNERAMQAFTSDNAAVLQRNGLEATGGNLYATHFLGAGAAPKVLSAPDSDPVSAHVSPDVIEANPFLARMNVGLFKRFANAKGGGGAAPAGDPNTAMAFAGGGAPGAAMTAQAEPAAAAGTLMGFDRNQIIALARSPQTRNIAVALLTKQAAPEEFGFTMGPDGTLVRTSKTRGTAEPVGNYGRPEKPPEAPTDVREYEYARAQGFPGSFVDFQLAQRKAGAPSTTVNTGEGNKFYETLDTANAKMFSDLQVAGVEAGASEPNLGRLESLLAAAPQGATGALKARVGEWGINTEGLDDLQAATALINKMIPAQRPAGSGPMSDRDVEMFKQSLPRIINQPGGNAKIMQSLRAMNEYTRKQGQVASAVANRAITPEQGRSELMKLENPLAGFEMPTAPAVGGHDGWTVMPGGVRIREKGQ